MDLDDDPRRPSPKPMMVYAVGQLARLMAGVDRGYREAFCRKTLAREHPDFGQFDIDHWTAEILRQARELRVVYVTRVIDPSEAEDES